MEDCCSDSDCILEREEGREGGGETETETDHYIVFISDVPGMEISRRK